MVQRSRRPARAAALVWALVLLAPRLVEAQQEVPPEEPEGTTVAERRRIELEPRGLRLGSFLVYPQVGFGVEYDDNIFARDAAKEADAIALFSPVVTASSQWTRHTLSLSAGADLGRYRDFPSENYDDWRLTGEGEVNVAPSTRALVGGGYAGLHQPRDSPDDTAGLTPVPYTLASAYVDFDHRPGRLFITPAFIFSRFEFEDVPALIGDEIVEIDQGDRDRNEYTLSLEGGVHSTVPGRSSGGASRAAYLRVRGFIRDYDRLQNISGFDRSSDGFEAGAGVRLGSPGLLRAEIYGGYRRQSYQSPLPDVSTPIFDVSLHWSPSEISTLQAGAGRDIVETTALIYSGFVSTEFRAGLDHELRRNVTLNVSGTFTLDDYVGLEGATRTDRTVAVGAGVTWLFGRRGALAGRYEYSGRVSTDDTVPEEFPSDDFERHRAWVRIELRR